MKSKGDRTFPRRLRQVLIYLILLGGALVFAWPFLWMAATSAKLDRELFSETLNLLPEAPSPARQSPYLQEDRFAHAELPRAAEALPILEQQLASAQVTWPNDVDRAKLLRGVARGLLERMAMRLPADTWKLPAPELTNTLASNLDSASIAEVITHVRRAFGLGQLRVRSYDLEEDQLIKPEEASQGWEINSPARAHLQAVSEGADRFAELSYNFNSGQEVTLSRTFATSFPIARLHRIELYLRPDDSWHALTMFVEKNGVRYQAERTLDLADTNWLSATWQERGPDDRPDKIRTWTLLREVGRGAQYVNGTNSLRVSLHLQKRTLVEAWWAKIRRNYRLTLDYTPFWRYVGTSVFLVILNLAGTLLSCSLVAYSFARLHWPGRRFCFALLLATMMIPAQVTMIPQFLIMQKLGWYNTLYPLWIVSFVAPAFYVFLLRQFLKGIPRDLEDAARLDGCGFLRIYWHIMLPLVKPTLAAIAIFTFIGTWNDFMGPLIYLSDQRLYPLSFGLYAFQVQVSNPGTAAGMGMTMAASLLMTLPVIAIFFFAQRYFLQGVTLTGMKG